MIIWFEITNSPHINLFRNIIRDLQKDNTVVITCRPLANTIELLKLNGFTFDIIGKHYGKYFINKLIGFPIRIIQLIAHFRNNKPAIAIGQSSFQMPIAAKILGIPMIYMNDNEHAMGNIPSFIFASKILIPEYLEIKKVKRQFAKKNKIIQYPGIKEGIYLWRILENIQKKDHCREKTIFFRPEPRTAQYYSGRLNFTDPLLLEIKDKYNIFVVPRDDIQKDHFRSIKFSGVHVLEKPMNLTDIFKKCDLFIGAGGTMTREMALAGIPTISTYQNELLDVDKFLITQGILFHTKKLDSSYIEKILNINNNNEAQQKLLTKGQKAEILIKSLIKEYNTNA